MEASLEETTRKGTQEAGTRLGRQVRSSLLRELRKELKQAEGIVVVAIHRVPTRSLNELRSSLKLEKANLLLVNNSLCRIVLKELECEALAPELKGACGVSPIRGDIAAATKLLTRFSKENEGFVLRTGVLKGRMLNREDLTQIAGLPPREILLSQLLGNMQSPVVGLLGVLQGLKRKLVGTLTAFLQKKEKSERPTNKEDTLASAAE